MALARRLLMLDVLFANLGFTFSEMLFAYLLRVPMADRA